MPRSRFGLMLSLGEVIPLVLMGGVLAMDSGNGDLMMAGRVVI